MKNKYSKPNIEFIKFLIEDLITTSGNSNNDTGSGDGGTNDNSEIELPSVPTRF